MEPSESSLFIAMTIIAIDTVIVLVVFGMRRGRFKGPRIPRSIGSVIPWIANSRMIDDFRGTYSWTNAQRQTHLEKLDKRYSFRLFLREDNQWRFAVDEEPRMVSVKVEGTPPTGEGGGEAVMTVMKPPEEIELSVVENRGTPPETPVEPPPPPEAVEAMDVPERPENREQDSRAT
jgi:hypothetical protein